MKKKKRGTDISDTEEECGGECFAPDMVLCCLCLFYKTKKSCDWLLGECVNHTEQCFKQAQEKNILVFTVKVVFLGHGWPDKCTE